jgi:prolyl-tRNA synthetase
MMIEADSGAIGGKDSQEFMAVTDIGEDEIIVCNNCGTGANVEKATSIKPKIDCQPPLDINEIATHNHESIDQLAKFLKIPARQILKAVFYSIDKQIIIALIRGDLEVNEIKLKKALHASEIRIANDEEVKKAGLVVGSTSPIGLSGIKIIADESITSGTNFVAGANKQGYHFANVNYPRDFSVDILADITNAKEGDLCTVCGNSLNSVRGMEVGHVFKLGVSISEKLDTTFVDENGIVRPIIMGCYGIGIGRLLAAVIEHNHDEKGIVWPKSIAPFQIYLCPLYMDNPDVVKEATLLYTTLSNLGYDVLLDDRSESPGIKFNDADLLGIPLRITISPRSLEKNCVEIKLRNDTKAELLAINDLTAKIELILE